MIQKWLFSVFAKKALVSIVKAVVSYLTAGVMADQMTKYGVQVDPNRLQEGLTLAGLALLKFFEDKRDLAKQNKEAQNEIK